MGLLRKFQQILPRLSLLTIYKTFIRSRLDYADIICDEAYNSTFNDKLESFQYNACLAITGAIRDTSTERIYQKLGSESLNSGVGLENCVIFIRYSMKNPPCVYSI